MERLEVRWEKKEVVEANASKTKVEGSAIAELIVSEEDEMISSKVGKETPFKEFNRLPQFSAVKKANQGCRSLRR